MRKSAFKMYQVLRVGDCLIQSLLVTSNLYSPLLHRRGQTQDEENQGVRGRDRPLLHKELATAGSAGVGRGRTLRFKSNLKF